MADRFSSEALRFLSSLRGRITDEEFRQFLTLVADFKKGTIHVDALVASVQLLFGNHPDLFRAFDSFFSADHHIEEAEEPEEEDDDADRFLDSLKARVGEDDYVRVSIYIGMHSRNEISTHDLSVYVAKVLGSHGSDLLERLAFPHPPLSSSVPDAAGTSKKRPRDLDRDCGDDTKRRRPEKNNGGSSTDKDSCRPPVSYLDLMLRSWEEGEDYTSYRRPEEQKRICASGKASVLNYEFESEPHDGFAPKPKNWSSKERASILIEDDMFEMDMLVRSVEVTAKKVKKLLKLMELEDDQAVRSPVRVEERLSSSELSCIERLYDDYGRLVRATLLDNAKCMLPTIYQRLRQKIEELSERRKEFRKALAAQISICF